ncbi:hypothetical protein [Saccharopolyspora spinosa]|uniref:hypothetical protein n=1 Tax=Saccharopolyspora spinosa TaxID=60894 RepID=UPI001659D169|nr:hypothetical protein [Saccharopolyspora spinosa]
MTLVGFSELGRLSVEVEFHGRQQTFSFDAWPLPGLTRQIAAIFANAVASDGWVTSIHGAIGVHHAARQLVRHLHAEAADAEPLRIGSLRPEHLDRFDAALHERYRDTATGYPILMQCVRMLREADLRAAEQRDDEVDADEPVPPLDAITLLPETRDRLSWVSRFDWPENRPLDAYPPAVAARLREATEKDIDAVVQRITLDGAGMLAAGGPPIPGHRLAASDVVWLINAEGPLRRDAVQARFGDQPHIKVSELNRLVFPSERDLLPFLIRLGLDTGIPIECLKTLPADCLRNPDRARVTIRYLKRRAGQRSAWQTKVVRDGHPLTPGGLIRTVLTLTRRARELTGSPRLWVGVIGYSKLGEPSFKGGRPIIRRFVRDHDLRDVAAAADGGEQPYLDLELRRLRKTYKVERIRATRGRIRDWADDHSVRVAVNHYGNVPELRGEHEAAIEAALIEARLVSTAKTDTAPTEPEAAVSDTPPRVEPQVGSVPGVDLWVATCRDPYDSPFGRKGQLCPVSFFGCLRCSNATIHLGKLPALMQYLNHIVSQRERMSAEEWAAVHRDTYNRIVVQILPMFSEADIAKARVVAESTQRLVFLPPQLRTLEIA